MFKKLTLYNSAMAAITGFTIGWYAWESQSPLLLILAISLAVGSLIGGVIGCWPYLTERKNHAQTVERPI